MVLHIDAYRGRRERADSAVLGDCYASFAMCASPSWHRGGKQQSSKDDE